MDFSGASASVCLARATGNTLHAKSCGNVLQTLEMEDGSPLDTSIFMFDSSSQTLEEEFNNPRALTITSDGSEE